jgi:hypothetical protein
MPTEVVMRPYGVCALAHDDQAFSSELVDKIVAEPRKLRDVSGKGPLARENLPTLLFECLRQNVAVPFKYSVG